GEKVVTSYEVSDKIEVSFIAAGTKVQSLGSIDASTIQRFLSGLSKKIMDLISGSKNKKVESNEGSLQGQVSTLFKEVGRIEAGDQTNPVVNLHVAQIQALLGTKANISERVEKLIVSQGSGVREDIIKNLMGIVQGLVTSGRLAEAEGVIQHIFQDGELWVVTQRDQLFASIINAYIEAGNLDRAVAVYLNLKVNDIGIPTVMLLAQKLAEAGKVHEVEQVILTEKQLLQSGSSKELNVLTALNCYKALALFNAGRNDDGSRAITEIRTPVFSGDEDSVEALRALAAMDVYFSKVGEMVLGLQLSDSVRALYFTYLAIEFMQAGKKELAKLSMAKAEEFNSAGLDLNVEKIRAYSAIDDPGKVVNLAPAIFTVAVKFNVAKSRVEIIKIVSKAGYANLAKILFKDNALNETDETRLEMFSWVSQALVNDGRVEEVYALLKEYFLNDAYKAKALADIGHVLLKVGRMQEATEEFANAIEIARGSTGAIFTFVYIASRMAEGMREAGVKEPTEKETNPGLAMQELDKYCLVSTGAQPPDKAGVLEVSGRSKEADTLVDAAIDAQFRFSAASSLAVARAATGIIDEAVAVVNKYLNNTAAAGEFSSTKTLDRMMRLLLDAGRIYEAFNVLWHSQDTGLYSTKSVLLLCQAWVRAGKLEDAKRLALEISEPIYQYPVITAIAAALWRLGLHDQAREWILKLDLGKHPTESQILTLRSALAEYYAQTGDAQEAIHQVHFIPDVINNEQSRYIKIEVYAHIGEILSKQGLSSEAAVAFAKAQSAIPNQVLANTYPLSQSIAKLGAAYARSNDMSNAKIYFYWAAKLVENNPQLLVYVINEAVDSGALDYAMELRSSKALLSRSELVGIDKIVSALVKDGGSVAAEQFVNSVIASNNFITRSLCYREIAYQLALRGDNALADKYFQLALSFASKFKSTHQPLISRVYDIALKMAVSMRPEPKPVKPGHKEEKQDGGKYQVDLDKVITELQGKNYDYSIGAFVFADLGRTLAAKGDDVGAREMFKRGVELAEKLNGARKNEAILYILKAYLAAGSNRGVAINLQDINDKVIRAKAYAEIAAWNAKEGKIADAKKYFDLAVQTAGDAQSAELISQALVYILRKAMQADNADFIKVLLRDTRIRTKDLDPIYSDIMEDWTKQSIPRTTIRQVGESVGGILVTDMAKAASAVKLAQEGQTVEAGRIIAQLSSLAKYRALAGVARVLANTASEDTVSKFIDTNFPKLSSKPADQIIGTHFDSAMLFAYLGRMLAELGFQEKAKAYFLKALAYAEAIDIMRPELQAQAAYDVTRSMIEFGFYSDMAPFIEGRNASVVRAAALAAATYVKPKETKVEAGEDQQWLDGQVESILSKTVGGEALVVMAQIAAENGDTDAARALIGKAILLNHRTQTRPGTLTEDEFIKFAAKAAAEAKLHSDAILLVKTINNQHLKLEASVEVAVILMKNGIDLAAKDLLLDAEKLAQMIYEGRGKFAGKKVGQDAFIFIGETIVNAGLTVDTTNFLTKYANLIGTIGEDKIYYGLVKAYALKGDDFSAAACLDRINDHETQLRAKGLLYMALVNQGRAAEIGSIDELPPNETIQVEALIVKEQLLKGHAPSFIHPLQSARRIQDLGERVTLLTFIAKTMVEAKSDMAEQTFIEALQNVEHIAGNLFKEQSFIEVVKAMTEAGLIKEAIDAYGRANLDSRSNAQMLLYISRAIRKEATQISSAEDLDKNALTLWDTVRLQLDTQIAQAQTAYKALLDAVPAEFRSDVESEFGRLIEALYNEQMNEIVSRFKEAVDSKATDISLKDLPLERFSQRIQLIMQKLPAYLAESNRKVGQENYAARKSFYNSLFSNIFTLCANHDIALDSVDSHLLDALSFGWKINSKEQMTAAKDISQFILNLQEYNKNHFAVIHNIIELLAYASSKDPAKNTPIIVNQINKVLTLKNEARERYLTETAVAFEGLDLADIMEFYNNPAKPNNLGKVRSLVLFFTQDLPHVDLKELVVYNSSDKDTVNLTDKEGVEISQIAKLQASLPQTGNEVSALMDINYFFQRVKDHAEYLRSNGKRGQALPERSPQMEAENLRNIFNQSEPDSSRREITQNSKDATKGMRGELNVGFYLALWEGIKVFVEEAGDNGTGALQEIALLIAKSTKAADGQVDLAGFFGTGKYTIFEGVDILQVITKNNERAYEFTFKINRDNTGRPLSVKLIRMRSLDDNRLSRGVTIRRIKYADNCIPELDKMLAQRAWKTFAGLAQDDNFKINFVEYGSNGEAKKQQLVVESEVLSEENMNWVDKNNGEQRSGVLRLISTKDMPMQVIDGKGLRVRGYSLDSQNDLKNLFNLIPSPLLKHLEKLGIVIQIPLSLTRTRDAFDHESEYRATLNKLIAIGLFKALAYKALTETNPQFVFEGFSMDLETNDAYIDAFDMKKDKAILQLAKKINEGRLDEISQADMQGLLIENGKLDKEKKLLKLIQLLKVATNPAKPDEKISLLDRRIEVQKRVNKAKAEAEARKFEEAGQPVSSVAEVNIPFLGERISQAKRIASGHNMMDELKSDPGKYIKQPSTQNEKELLGIANKIATPFGIQQILLVDEKMPFAGLFMTYQGKHTMFLNQSIAEKIGVPILGKGAPFDYATNTIVHELGHLLERFMAEDAEKLWQEGYVASEISMYTHDQEGSFAASMQEVALASLAAESGMPLAPVFEGNLEDLPVGQAISILGIGLPALINENTAGEVADAVILASSIFDLSLPADGSTHTFTIGSTTITLKVDNTATGIVLISGNSITVNRQALENKLRELGVEINDTLIQAFLIHELTEALAISRDLTDLAHTAGLMAEAYYVQNN
ncbi:MAG: hypothetical protein NTZ63_06830, partial [Candidatus Omnitrophica bacterium]|nr:hypothetical protein [Candidatus Omnitrophota bacterium]